MEKVTQVFVQTEGRHVKSPYEWGFFSPPSLNFLISCIPLMSPPQQSTNLYPTPSPIICHSCPLSCTANHSHSSSFLLSSSPQFSFPLLLSISPAYLSHSVTPPFFHPSLWVTGEVTTAMFLQLKKWFFCLCPSPCLSNRLSACIT